MSDQHESLEAGPHPAPIAVIGAGFSGTMAAIQLLARLPPHQSVLLCERAERFGSGRAYATGNPDHLLNVRAANMSAYPDRPSHFEDWLSKIAAGEAGTGAGNPAIGQGHVGIWRTPAGTFAARGLYGDYLAALLTEAVTGGSTPRLHLINDMIIDLVPDEDRLVMVAEGGRRVDVAGAVLAMGNLALPQEPESRFRGDPWKPEHDARLHPDHPVLIIGTGLSMVDAVISLRRQGFRGQIIALSRRGQIPAVHVRAAPWPRPDFTAAETRSITQLLARIRREVASAAEARIAWHGVIDALRPVTDALWLGLPPADQARFLRHLRPFWDTHRHRSAPPTGAAIADEIEAGSLQVLAGKLVAIEDQTGEARVTYRPRGIRTQNPRRAAHLRCSRRRTGRGYDRPASAQSDRSRPCPSRSVRPRSCRAPRSDGPGCIRYSGAPLDSGPLAPRRILGMHGRAGHPQPSRRPGSVRRGGAGTVRIA